MSAPEGAPVEEQDGHRPGHRSRKPRFSWARPDRLHGLGWRDLLFALLVVVAVTGIKGQLGSRWYPVPERPGSFGGELGHIAANAAGGHGLSVSMRPGEYLQSAWFSPIYPLFVERVFRWRGIFTRDSALFLVGANAVFQGLTAGLLFLLGTRLAGRWIGLLASALFLLDPNAWAFLSWTWPSHLFALLLTAHLVALLTLPPSARTAGPVAGLTLGLALLTDGAAITVVPVTLWHFARSRMRGGSWLALGTFALSLLACLAPWALRNRAQMGSLNPLRGNVGVNLWVGNHPENRSEDFHGILVSPWHDRAEQRLFVNMGEREYDRYCRERALERIELQPVRFAQDSVRRATAFWFGEWWLRFAHVPWYVTLGFFVSTLTAAFGAWRARLLGVGPLVAAALLFGLPYYVTVYGHGRYRIPIQPTLWALSALALAPRSSRTDEPDAPLQLADGERELE